MHQHLTNEANDIMARPFHYKKSYNAMHTIAFYVDHRYEIPLSGFNHAVFIFRIHANIFNFLLYYLANLDQIRFVLLVTDGILLGLHFTMWP